MSGLARKLVPLLDRYTIIRSQPVFRSLSLYPKTLSASIPDAPKRYPHDSPERDYVNFPAPRQPVYPGKVRLGFIPNEWFEALYEKTGVTGPYILLWGGLTTILSKEYFVFWVDSFEHMVMLAAVVWITRTFGGKIGAALDKQVEKEEIQMKSGLENNLKKLNEQLAELETERSAPEVSNLMFESKKENVGLQLEVAYRERVQRVFEETKKRLDYQVAMQGAHQRLEKQQMLNFILGEVNKAVGAKQERDALQASVNQLKSLAVKHANTI